MRTARWFAFALSIAVVVPAAAERGPRAPNPEREQAFAAQSGVSLRDAVAIVRQAFGGKVISAQEIDGLYRIRVVTNGRVRTVGVDRRGRLVKPEMER